MITTSATCNKIYEALALAQKEFPPIPKNKESEVRKDGKLLYKFKYADLPQIIESTRPALAAHKLGFTQSFVKTEAGWCLVTRLFCGDEWMDGGFVPVWFAGNDMKMVASALTYAKRYSLQAALGVAADEDIDLPPQAGEDLTITDTPKSPRNHAPGAQSPNPDVITFASKVDVDRLLSGMAQVGVSAGMILRRYKLKNWSDFTSVDLAEARNIGRMISAKKAKLTDYFKE